MPTTASPNTHRPPIPYAHEFPYHRAVLGSHLCTGCGCELCRIPAPPDPVYGLPVCTCPSCGTSVVRRKHRTRTQPVAFKRLDRAFNRMALSLFAIAVFAGSALLIAMVAAYRARDYDLSAWSALIYPIRTADKAELFSIALINLIVATTQLSSGIILSRLLWHWKTKQLALAWLGMLVVMAFLPTLYHFVFPTRGSLTLDLRHDLANRLQILVVLWIVTLAGLAMGKVSADERKLAANRRVRRSLRWARKQIRRRRVG